ncbi:hypothetical protein [Halotia branconii]|uniref:Uncharacterized protein n=1 Tax=Halotia branconii CENA392 TaxID=1539056 RepID=A0AAJ6PBV5_9CYAN|nr:hypothetical protein [Halotia branconii]WGV28319.1 hypothetical protein QI031_12975 [Halotia branconii CENA392]
MTQFWVFSRLSSAFEKIGTEIFATDIGNGWPLLPNRKKKPFPNKPSTPLSPIPDDNDLSIPPTSIPKDSEEKPSTSLPPIPDQTEERSVRSGNSFISFQVIYQVFTAVKSQFSCWEKEIWV